MEPVRRFVLPSEFTEERVEGKYARNAVKESPLLAMSLDPAVYFTDVLTVGK